MADAYDESELALLQYHVGDTYATSETNSRFSWYGLTGYPNAFFDGWDQVVGGVSGGSMFSYYDPKVSSHLTDPSPMILTTICSIVDGEGSVTANITLTDTITESNVVVQFVLYEDYGGNSQFVVRDMLPLENLTISSPGESVQLERDFTVSGSNIVDPENASAVVFVQSNTTKNVLQAANALPSAYYFVFAGIGTQHIISPPDTAVDFLSMVTNAGLEEDTLTVSIERMTPPGWVSYYIINGMVYYDSTEIALAPAEMESILVYVETDTMPSAGEVTIQVTSQGDPNMSRSQTFRVISGAQILLVDDDEGKDYEQYYQEALLADSASFGTWETKVDALTADVLANFETVIWFTGEARGEALTTNERDILQAYMDNGGNLFISGQNIGSSIGGTPFFAYTLHAIYYLDNGGYTSLDGVPGDPITDGLTIGITGGDGANNQTSPDKIKPRDADASSIFKYGPGETENGAIKVETDVFKAVYFAFGFEGINNASHRQTVMHNVLEWFRPITEPVFVRGDVQADGDQDLFDGLYLLNWLGGLNPTPPCLKAADVDDDEEIDLFDALYHLNWLGGINPPPPGPCCEIPDNCGEDPTPDELPCSSYAPCGWNPGPVIKTSLVGQAGASRLAVLEQSVENGVAVVPVVLTNAEPLVAFAFTIEYDPHLLTAKVVDNSGLVTEEFDFFVGGVNEPGVVKVVAVSDLNMGNGVNRLPAGDFQVASVVFQVNDHSLIHDVPLKLTVSTLAIDHDRALSHLTSSGIVKAGLELPVEFVLGQNYPNPFNPLTEIRYALPEDNWVTLQVYNSLGQQVATLVDERQSAGHWNVQWNARDDRGLDVASGIYLYRLRAGELTITRRMVLLR